MSQLSAREILDAIRKLSEAERRSLIDELINEDFTESAEDIVAVQEGLDQAERGQLIDHEDLATYMATRRKERGHTNTVDSGSSGHPARLGGKR